VSEYEALFQACQNAEIERLNSPQPSHRQDMNDPPVTWIKELGYDSFLSMSNGNILPPKEVVFFIDALDRNSFNATDEAVREAIFRFREMARVLELYLENGRNNFTTDWIDSVKMTYQEQWQKRGFDVHFDEDAPHAEYEIKCKRCSWQSSAPTVQEVDQQVRAHCDTCKP